MYTNWLSNTCISFIKQLKTDKEPFIVVQTIEIKILNVNRIFNNEIICTIV